jgi:hypothetical protein
MIILVMIIVIIIHSCTIVLFKEAINPTGAL